MVLGDLFKPKWKHSDPKVRKEAIKLITDQAILEEIVWTEKESSIRVELVEKITNKELLTRIALNDKDEKVCKAAIDVLAYIGDQNAIDSLIEIFQTMSSRDKSFCKEALHAIEQIGGEKANSAFLKILHLGFSFEIVRLSLARIMKQLEPSTAFFRYKTILEYFIARVSYDEEKVKAEIPVIVAEMAQLGDQRCVELFLEIESKLSYLIGHCGIPGLIAMGSSAVEPLMDIILNGLKEMANEKNWKTKSLICYAVEALGEIGDHRATKLLISLLNEEDLVLVAVTALGCIGDKAAVESLSEVLRNHEEEQVIKNAAIALGKIGGQKSVEVLLSELKKSLSAGIGRMDLIEGIGLTGDKRGIGTILHYIENFNFGEYKLEIAGSLAKFGDNAIDDLKRKLLDKNSDICRIAALALKSILGDERISRLTSTNELNWSVDLRKIFFNELGLWSDFWKLWADHQFDLRPFSNHRMSGEKQEPFKAALSNPRVAHLMLAIDYIPIRAQSIIKNAIDKRFDTLVQEFITQNKLEIIYLATNYGRGIEGEGWQNYSNPYLMNGIKLKGPYYPGRGEDAYYLLENHSIAIVTGIWKKIDMRYDINEWKGELDNKEFSELIETKQLEIIIEISSRLLKNVFGR